MNIGLLVGTATLVVAVGVVVLDGTIRGLPTDYRLRWAGVVGVVGLVGFLLPYFVDAIPEFVDAVIHHRSAGDEPSDLALLESLLWFGVYVTAAAILGYLVGSRRGPFAAGEGEPGSE